MHFQLPPHDHDKLVYCIRGRVMDVLLDLRKSSPTYGRSFGNEISANNHLMLYIPKGVAHGFLSLEDDSVLVYKTTTIHFPSHDAGVRWDSFGYTWPDLIANCHRSLQNAPPVITSKCTTPDGCFLMD